MSAKWPMVKLSEVLSQYTEYIDTPEPREYPKLSVKLYGRGVILDTPANGATLKMMRHQIAKAGQVILSEIWGKKGAIGFVPDEGEGALCTSHFFLFDFANDKLDRRWLQAIFHANYLERQLDAEAKGTTGYAAVRPKILLACEIPLPPLPEQRRIVARIEELAAKINEARALRQQAVVERELWWPNILREVLIGKYRSLDKAGSGNARDLLSASAERNTGNVRTNYNNARPEKPTLIEDGPEKLPRSWVWTTLGSVTTHIIDCINDTPDFADYDTGLIGLKSTNIRPYQLDLSRRWFMTSESFAHWNRREKPQRNDIVLTREAPMGNACLVPPHQEFCLTQRLLLLRTDPKTILPNLLLHYLNSRYFQDQVEDKCRGLTTPHIRVQDTPNFILPLPSMDQQHSIVADLEALQAKVDALKTLQAETASEIGALLPSILDKAFKGELK